MGSGICVAIATIANAINAKVFPSLLSLLGFHGTFWLYSSVGLVMAGYGWATIPDNRGLSLVRIEEQMSGGGMAAEVKQEKSDTLTRRTAKTNVEKGEVEEEEGV